MNMRPVAVAIEYETIFQMAREMIMQPDTQRQRKLFLMGLNVAREMMGESPIIVPETRH
jgi:hypothetical protein